MKEIPPARKELLTSLELVPSPAHVEGNVGNVDQSWDLLLRVRFWLQSASFQAVTTNQAGSNTSGDNHVGTGQIRHSSQPKTPAVAGASARGLGLGLGLFGLVDFDGLGSVLGLPEGLDRLGLLGGHLVPVALPDGREGRLGAGLELGCGERPEEPAEGLGVGPELLGEHLRSCGLGFGHDCIPFS